MIRMNDLVREGRKHAAKFLGENLTPLTAERPKEHDDGNSVVLSYSDARRIWIRFRRNRTQLDQNGEPTLEVIATDRSFNFAARPKEPTRTARKRRAVV